MQPSPRRWGRLSIVLLVASLLVAAGALRLRDLGSRGYFVPDEQISVKAGNYYVLGNQTGYGFKYDEMGNFVSLWPHPYNYEHPPLAKVLIGYSGLVFGHTPEGYRLLGALLGAALPLLIFLVARKFMSARWALLPTAVVAVDPLLVQISRLATPDVYFLFFAAAAFVVAAYVRGAAGVLGSGVLVGLSAACKWFGLFPLLALVVYQVLTNKGLLARLLRPFSIYIIAAAVYLASYYNYFVGGPTYPIALPHTVPSYLLLGPHTFADFYRLQSWMVDFTSQWHVAGSAYGLVATSPLIYSLGDPSSPLYVFNILLFLGPVQLILGYLMKMKPPALASLWALTGLIPLATQGFVWYLAYEIPGSALVMGWFGSRAWERNKRGALIVPLLLVFTEALLLVLYAPR